VSGAFESRNGHRPSNGMTHDQQQREGARIAGRTGGGGRRESAARVQQSRYEPKSCADSIMYILKEKKQLKEK
jgi:hypothetical protein